MEAALQELRMVQYVSNLRKSPWVKQVYGSPRKAEGPRWKGPASPLSRSLLLMEPTSSWGTPLLMGLGS